MSVFSVERSKYGCSTSAYNAANYVGLKISRQPFSTSRIISAWVVNPLVIKLMNECSHTDILESVSIIGDEIINEVIN